MLASKELGFLLDSLPDTVLFCDRDGTIRACNNQCAELLGYAADELVGQPVEILIPLALREAHVGYRKAYTLAPKRRSMYQLQEINAIRKDGMPQPVSIALSPIGIDGETMTIVSIRDNTSAVAARRKEREMYARLLQKQRLENLGLLSSGIAHDFRNLLTVVLGNTELAMIVAGAHSTALAPHLNAIHSACGRLQEMSGRILRYAAGREARPERINLNDAVTEIAVLLERALAPGTQLHLDCAVTPPALVVDPGHVFQLLLNLILNANDAIGPKGGRITVRTGYARDMVFLQVEDDGRGMDPVTRDNILEPFYTTREGGVGLGLSLVRDIMQRYDGSVDIASEVGKGSVFTLRLPAVVD